MGTTNVVPFIQIGGDAYGVANMDAVKREYR